MERKWELRGEHTRSARVARVWYVCVWLVEIINEFMCMLICQNYIANIYLHLYTYVRDISRSLLV